MLVDATGRHGDAAVGVAGGDGPCGGDGGAAEAGGGDGARGFEGEVHAREKRRAALDPPKPRLTLMAAERPVVWPGVTRAPATRGSGSRRLICGGRRLVCRASKQSTASMAPAAPRV